MRWVSEPAGPSGNEVPPDARSESDEAVVSVGLAADPGLPTKVVHGLSDELPECLARRVSNGVRWKVEVRSEELSLDAQNRIPIVKNARARMPEQGWDLMVCLTDLPRRDGERPIVADVSTAHGVAMTSLPAIGGLRLRPHVRDALVHVIGVLARETLKLPTDHPPPDGYHHIRRRPTELISPVRQVPSGDDDIDVHLALTGMRGWVRLLLGMVRDNRPWRLLPGLSKALAAATATAAFGIFYYTIWEMADALSPARLALIALFAVVAMVAWLIVYNGLWEQTRDPERMLLYNTATVLTIFIGVVCMYVVLFGVMLLAALAVISTDYLAARLGHPAGISDYISLTWLASSMGIFAGALGSSLETEDDVRQATYSKREPERRDRMREQEQEEADTDDPGPRRPEHAGGRRHVQAVFSAGPDDPTIVSVDDSGPLADSQGGSKPGSGTGWDCDTDGDRSAPDSARGLGEAAIKPDGLLTTDAGVRI